MLDYWKGYLTSLIALTSCKRGVLRVTVVPSLTDAAMTGNRVVYIVLNSELSGGLLKVAPQGMKTFSFDKMPRFLRVHCSWNCLPCGWGKEEVITP